MNEDETEAICIAKRRGQPDVIRTFSIADAKQAGLWGKPGPWQSSPKRMLQMRARSFALRDQFPDVLKGINSREESEDIVQMQAAESRARKTVDVVMPSREEDTKPDIHVATEQPPAESIPAGPSEELALVLRAIAAAHTLDELEELRPTVRLLQGAEKKLAIESWRRRESDCKASAPTVDSDAPWDLVAAKVAAEPRPIAPPTRREPGSDG